LWTIRESLGTTVADRIIINAQFGFAPDTSFAAAAKTTTVAAMYGAPRPKRSAPPSLRAGSSSSSRIRPRRADAVSACQRRMPSARTGSAPGRPFSPQTANRPA
jgi:hypothetical protein